MPKRRCRDPIRTDGLTMEQVIEMAIDAFGWSRKKVLSWYELENPSLRKARPSELVDRGDTDKIIDFLERRKRERIDSQQRNAELKAEKEEPTSSRQADRNERSVRYKKNR